jgi:hypothetical protein
MLRFSSFIIFCIHLCLLENVWWLSNFFATYMSEVLPETLMCYTNVHRNLNVLHKYLKLIQKP